MYFYRPADGSILLIVNCACPESLHRIGPLMRRMYMILLVLFPCVVMAADGQEAMKTLASAGTLRCVFSIAIATNWEVETYQSRPQKGFSFTIEAIDPVLGNAKAVSTGGASHLEMIALPNIRHFLGFTAGGGLNTTSVHGFFAGDKGGLLASHSVHMASEPPRTYQHYGICTAK